MKSFILFILIAMYTSFSIYAQDSSFVADLAAFVKQKNIQPDQLSLEEQFALIEQYGVQQFPRRREPVQGMDRDPRWSPYQNNKICLSDGTEMSASPIQSSNQNEKNYDRFIATQAPFQHNVHLFWQMIWEQKIDQIVMLTELFDVPTKELCYPYWAEPFKPLELANGITVELMSERWLLQDQKENIQIRVFHVHFKGETRQVIHYWYHNWRDQTIPSQHDTLNTLVHTVKQNKIESESTAPILVHCAGGVGRTGVFITVYHMAERKLCNEAPVDLFEFVAHLRWQRPKLVSKPEQYKFCFESQ